MPKAKDLTGMRFGRLSVVSQAATTTRTKWNCVCDCGSETVVFGADMLRGKSTSCGCFRKEDVRKRKTSHGCKGTAEYAAWKGMISRCENANSDYYKNYGGRGISVCERWRVNFQSFLDDMGKKPFDSASIDRIDNNGNYEPGNCRWATRKQQANNKRNNRVVSFGDKKMTTSELAEMHGLKPSALKARLNLGWEINEATSTPSGNKRPSRKLIGAGGRKLSPEGIAEVREKRGQGRSLVSLGKEYHLSPTTISLICQR